MLAIKLIACFQIPVMTSDLVRHLGYASHAFDQGFRLYETRAIDFAPEAWTRYWSDQPYIYPPLTLLFFWLFASLHLGLVWVKLALLLIDAAVALLFWRHVSWQAGLLYFLAPISLWYTAHEGQFEVLQTLLIALCALAVRARHWRQAGLWLVLSVQVKQFGLLLLPWLAYELWRDMRQPGALNWQPLARLLQGSLLGILPFLPFYLHTPGILLLPFTSGSDGTYNPFAWNLLQPRLFGWNFRWLVAWNALFSYLPLLLLVRSGWQDWRRGRPAEAIPLLPSLLFWGVTKSLRWGQFWYTLVAPGYLFTLQRRSLVHVLLLLHLLQCLHSTTSILIKPRGAMEPPESLAVLEACLYRCDPQRRAPHLLAQ